MRSRGGHLAGWFLAEIAIVAVGILIAFQVDEWRMNRLDRAMESDVLASMSDELDQHYLSLREYRDFVGRQARASIDLDEYLATVAARSDVEIVRMFSDVWSGYVWEAESPVYLGWRDSGRLDLISDPGLRAAIYDYHNILLGWLGTLSEANDRDRNELIRAAVRDIYRTPSSLDDGRDELLFRVVEPIEALPRNPEFIGLLNILGSSSAFLALRIEDTMQKNRELGEKINAHLAGL